MPLASVYVAPGWLPKDNDPSMFSDKELLTDYAVTDLGLIVLPPLLSEVDRKTYTADEIAIKPFEMSDISIGVADWQVIIHPPAKRFWFFHSRRSERRLKRIAEGVHVGMQRCFAQFEAELEDKTDEWRRPAYDIEVIPLTMRGLSADIHGQVLTRW